MPCKNSIITETQLVKIKGWFEIGDSKMDFIPYFEKNKEAFYYRGLPKDMQRDDDLIKRALNQIRNRNILGNNEVADKVFDLNNFYLLDRTKDGESSETFARLESAYIQGDKNIIKGDEAEEVAYQKAYVAKAKLYSRKVSELVGDYTLSNDLTELIDLGYLNKQGEPVIEYRDDSILLKTTMQDVLYESFALDGLDSQSRFIISLKRKSIENKEKKSAEPIVNQIVISPSNYSILMDQSYTVGHQETIDGYLFELMSNNNYTFDINALEASIAFDLATLKNRIEESKRNYDQKAIRDLEDEVNLLRFMSLNKEFIIKDILTRYDYLLGSQGRSKELPFDVDKNTVSPIVSTPSQVKLLFHGLRNSSKGNVLYDYKDPLSVQYDLLEILQGVDNSFDAMVDRLESFYDSLGDIRKAKYLWLDDLIYKLKEDEDNLISGANSSLQSLFVASMSKVHKDLPYVKEYFDKGTKKIQTKLVSSNRTIADIKRQWKDNLMSSDLFLPSTDANIVRLNKEYLLELIASFNETKKHLEDNRLVDNPYGKGKVRQSYVNMKQGVVASLLAELGIELSIEHYDFISSNNYKVGKNSDPFQLKINTKNAFEQGSMLGNMYQYLNELLISNRTNYARSEIKLLNKYVDKVAAMESVYSKHYTKRHGSIIGKKKYYNYTNPTLWEDKLNETKRKFRLNNLKNDTYVSTNYWIQNNTINQLELITLPGGVLQGNKVNDNKLSKLSKRDILMTKLGLLHDELVFDESGEHLVKVVMLTPSDNSNFDVIKAPGFNLKHLYRENHQLSDNPRNILSNDALKAYFESSILPEINRIRKHKNTLSSSEAWNKGGGKFINWPELNEYEIDITYDTPTSTIGKEDSGERLDKAGQLALTEGEKVLKRITSRQENTDGKTTRKMTLLQALTDPEIDYYDLQTEYIHDKVMIDYLTKYFAERHSKMKERMIDGGFIEVDASRKPGNTMSLNVIAKENYSTISKYARGKAPFNRDKNIDDIVMYNVFQEEFVMANTVQMFVGDPVMYYTEAKNSSNFQDNANATLLNLLKRMRNNNTPRSKMNMDVFGQNKNMGVLLINEPIANAKGFDDGFYESIGLTEDERSVYENIKEMDAAEYITVKTMLKYMEANGEISNEQFNEEYDHYQKTGKLKSPNLRIGFTKDVYTGEIWDDAAETYIPIHIKSGTTVLYGPLVDGNSQWEKVRKRLEKLEDDPNTPDHIHLIPPTALKIGTPSWERHDLFTKDEDGNLNYNENLDADNINNNLMIMPLRYRGRQVNMPNKDLENKQAKISFSTQMKQFIFADIINKITNEFPANFKGKRYTGKDLFKEYIKIIEDNYKSKVHGSVYTNPDGEDKSTTGFYGDTGRDENGLIPEEYGAYDTSKVVAFFKKRLLEMSESMESINIDPEMLETDINGKFSRPLFDKPNGYLETLTRSIVNEVLFDTKVEGNSFPVISSHNMIFDNPGYTDIIWMEDKPVHELKGPGEGKTSIDVLIPSKLTSNNGKLIDLFEKKNGKYIWLEGGEKGKNGYVLNEGIKREIFNTVGYRIPAPGHSYFLDINIVGFLPPSMDVIMGPNDIVAKTGGDFDADKLFITIQNHKVFSDGKVEVFADTKDQEVSNNYTQIFKSILSNPNPKIQKIIYTPVDNPAARNQAEVYREISKENLQNLLSPYQQEKLLKQNNSSKDGTGIYASMANLFSHLRIIEDVYGQKTNYNMNQWIIPSEGNKGMKAMLTTPVFTIGEYTMNGVLGNSKIKKRGQEKDIDIDSIMVNNARKLSNAVDNAAKQYMADLGEGEHSFSTIIGMMMFGGTHSVTVKKGDGSDFDTELIYLMLKQPIVQEFINKIEGFKTGSVTPEKEAEIFKSLFANPYLKAKNNLETSLDLRDKGGYPIVSFQEMNKELGSVTTQDLMNRINGNQSYGDNLDKAILGMFLSYSKIGRQITEVNSFISPDRKGLPDTFHGMKKFKDSLKTLKTYEPIDIISLITTKDKSVKGMMYDGEHVKPNSFIGHGIFYSAIEIEETLFKGLESIYGKEIYTKVLNKVMRDIGMESNFEKKLHPNYPDMAKEVANILSLCVSNIGPVRPHIYDGDNLMSDLKYWRLKLFFDKNHDSLGTFIRNVLKNNKHVPSIRNNFFLNSLDISQKKHPDITTIFLQGDHRDTRVSTYLKEGIIQLLESDKEISNVLFNGEAITFRELAEMLYIYTTLGADKNFNADFSHLFPDYIVGMMHDVKSAINNKEHLRNDELINNISFDMIRHEPWRIKESYNYTEDLIDAGFILSANGKKVKSIKHATSVGYNYKESKGTAGVKFPSLIKVSSYSENYVLKKKEDIEGYIVYDVFDALGSNDLNEHDPYSVNKKSILTPGYNTSLGDEVDLGLTMLQEKETLDYNVTLPGINRVNEVDIPDLTDSILITSSLPDGDPLRKEMSKPFMNLMDVLDVLNENEYSDEINDAVSRHINYRLKDYYDSALENYQALMSMEAESQANVDPDVIEDIYNESSVLYKLLKQYNFINKSNQSFLSSDYFSPDMVVVRDIKEFLDSVILKDALDSQGVSDIKEFTERFVNLYSNEIQGDKDKLAVLSKYLPFIKTNYYYNSSKRGNAIEYDPVSKSINISLKDISKLRRDVPAHIHLARGILRESGKFYFETKVNEYLQEHYQLIGSPPFLKYKLIKENGLDPTIKKIVELFTLNQEVVGDVTSEDSLESIDKKLDFYLSSDLISFIANTFDISNESGDLSSKIGEARFSYFNEFLSKDGDASIEIAMEAMDFMSTGKYIGMYEDNQFVDGIDLINKNDC